MPEDRPPASDTGCYLYGVVPLGSSRPSLQGIDGAEVAYVEHGELAAAVTEMTLDRPPGRRAELMAHTGVVDSLAASGPVLPMQFGSVVEDRDSVVNDVLAPSHDRFVELLAHLAGSRQLNLRATYVEDQVLGEIVGTRPDIADLHRRTRTLPAGTMHPDLVRLGELVSHALEQRRDVDAEAVLEVVRPFVRDEAIRNGGGVDHLLELALLVENERIPDLEEALETFAEAVHERVRLRLTGPVAPYDFAEAGAWG